MAHGHATNRAILLVGLLNCLLLVALGLQNFFAAIIASRADMVAAVLLTGCRLDGQLGSADSVMRTMHAALGR